MHPVFHKSVIIGAGPAGLACGGRLKKAGIDFVILERSDDFAFSWRHHYDRLHLHTVSKYSHLPYKEFPNGFPVYVPKDLLVQYYEDYVKEFNLPIKTKSEVKAIEKNGEFWEIICENGPSYTTEEVIIATGFNRKENLPSWDGMTNFDGEIIHSSNYKNTLPYQGKTVLIVGMGNSGAEIALDLCQNKVTTYISIRGPVNIVPRDFLGNPTQITAKKMKVLPNFISDWIGKKVRDIAIGNLSKYGIETPNIAPAKQLRDYAQTPVLDLGTVSAIKEGKILVKPAIDHFDQDHVFFSDGSKLKCDAVILATGYSPSILDFFKGCETLLNKKGVPVMINAEGNFEGIHFVGFDAYSNGILESIFNDSGTAIQSIINRNAAG